MTIIGSSFKLTVRYPKIPWQHIKNSKNAVIRLILEGNLYLNAVTVSAIATKPKKAAKYLWTTSVLPCRFHMETGDIFARQEEHQLLR